VTGQPQQGFKETEEAKEQSWKKTAQGRGCWRQGQRWKKSKHFLGSFTSGQILSVRRLFSSQAQIPSNLHFIAFLRKTFFKDGKVLPEMNFENTLAPKS
jgi:hypothetical protein